MESKIITKNGCKLIEINGKAYLPAAYRSFRPKPADIGVFYRSGVRLFQMLVSGRNNAYELPYSCFGGVWKGHFEYDFTAFDNQMRMFTRFAPDGYFMVMLQLDMPKWWLDEFGADADSFAALGEAVFCKQWLSEADEFLKAFLTYAEEKYGDRIFSYAISAGTATEWFNKQNVISKTKLDDYKKCSGKPTSVKTYEDLKGAENAEILPPQNDAVSFLQYASKFTPDLICRFAAQAQCVINKTKPLAVFFGYSDMPRNWQNITDTNGYEKVWKCPDIDILLSPAAYEDCRSLDGASSYQYAVDSVSLNGKLYLHEIDHRTYLAAFPLENGISLESEAYKTEFDTVQVLRRELCCAMQKNAALWWFDFFGGYYGSPLLESEIKLQMDIMKKMYSKKRENVSQTAVFVDPMSFLYLPDNADITRAYARTVKNNLHKSGVAFDMYNLNDITKLDLSDYKMLIFLNAFDMSESIRGIIKDSTALKVFIHAPGYVRGGRLDAFGIEDVTGIKIEEFSSDKAEYISFEGEKFGFEKPMKPQFKVTDSGAEIIGRFENGNAACAVKNNSVYVAAGNLPSTLLRHLAKRAGVHVYTDSVGALYADSRFVAFQSNSETEIEIKMPFSCRVKEMFGQKTYVTQDNKFTYSAQKGATNLFAIEEIFDI